VIVPSASVVRTESGSMSDKVKRVLRIGTNASMSQRDGSTSFLQPTNVERISRPREATLIGKRTFSMSRSKVRAYVTKVELRSRKFVAKPKGGADKTPYTIAHAACKQRHVPSLVGLAWSRSY